MTVRDEVQEFAFAASQRRGGARERAVVRGALGHVGRTLGFLDVAVADVRDAQRASIEHINAELRHYAERPQGDNIMTDEEMAKQRRGSLLNELVQFRTETFYFFAQRLLDELVSAIDAYFAPSAVTLGRHKTLCSRLPTLLAKRPELQPPDPELLELACEAGERIKKFRDKHVAHVLRQDDLLKMRGLVWGPDERPRILITRLYPKPGTTEGETVASEDVEELSRLLAEYARSILRFLSANSGAAV